VNRGAVGRGPANRDARATDTRAAYAPAGNRTQTENDDPQPQVVLALGFLITNCAPSRPSL